MNVLDKWQEFYGKNRVKLSYGIRHALRVKDYLKSCFEAGIVPEIKTVRAYLKETPFAEEIPNELKKAFATREANDLCLDKNNNLTVHVPGNFYIIPNDAYLNLLNEKREEYSNKLMTDPKFCVYTDLPKKFLKGINPDPKIARDELNAFKEKINEEFTHKTLNCPIEDIIPYQKQSEMLLDKAYKLWAKQDYAKAYECLCDLEGIQSHNLGIYYSNYAIERNLEHKEDKFFIRQEKIRLLEDMIAPDVEITDSGIKVKPKDKYFVLKWNNYINSLKDYKLEEKGEKINLCDIKHPEYIEDMKLLNGTRLALEFIGSNHDSAEFIFNYFSKRDTDFKSRFNIKSSLCDTIERFYENVKSNSALNDRLITITDLQHLIYYQKNIDINSVSYMTDIALTLSNESNLDFRTINDFKSMMVNYVLTNFGNKIFDINVLNNKDQNLITDLDIIDKLSRLNYNVFLSYFDKLSDSLKALISPVIISNQFTNKNGEIILL